MLTAEKDIIRVLLSRGGGEKVLRTPKSILCEVEEGIIVSLSQKNPLISR
jgi:hypothetical protein